MWYCGRIGGMQSHSQTVHPACVSLPVKAIHAGVGWVWDRSQTQQTPVLMHTMVTVISHLAPLSHHVRPRLQLT